MLDDELREQLASWVRPVTSLPVPDIRVLRRRARRRVMGRTATAAAIIAVVAAAAVGLVSGLPGTGRPAGGRPVTGATNPTTPSCTGTCVDLFFIKEFGHHHSPNFILDVYQQHARIGQPIILHRASTNDPAEDFRAVDLGTVAGFYAAGRVSAAFALHYGCVAGGFHGAASRAGDFPDCFGLATIPYGHSTPTGACKVTTGCQAQFNDPAFEIEYTPDGRDSGLCVGVASTAVQEEGVTLQECGASSKTVWAVDLYDQPVESFFRGYYPLINGSDINFSQPFVLNYPMSGYPTDKPRPQLQVYNLTGYSTGFPPIANYSSVDDTELWGADVGHRG